MRKPVYTICDQQRLGSDCASTQSDQQFCGSLLCSIIPIVAKPKGSSLSLVSVAEQTGLTGRTPSKTGFLVTSSN